MDGGYLVGFVSAKTKQQFWCREVGVCFPKLCPFIYTKSLFGLCFTFFYSPQASSPGLGFISRVTLALWIFIDIRFIICYCLI
jgi:hypothetical protein